MDNAKLVQTYPGLDEIEPSPLQEQRERKVVYNGQLIEELLKKEVWQDLLGPTLHAMITNSIGKQKPDGRWIVGDWARLASSSEEKHFNAGYCSGLMEFSNFLVDSIKEKDRLFDKQRQEKLEKTNDLIGPMQEEES